MESEINPCGLCGALPCDWVVEPHKQLSSFALQFVTDDAARRFQKMHREMWPGAGWPKLDDVKALLIAALTPAPGGQSDE